MDICYRKAMYMIRLTTMIIPSILALTTFVAQAVLISLRGRNGYPNLCSIATGYSNKDCRTARDLHHRQFVSAQNYQYEETVNKKLWIDRKGEATTNPIVNPDEFKVITYNVLGPQHGESSKHSYAPVSVTKWTRRRDKLMQELRSINADILCLQEVSVKGLKETYIPGLKSIGLECGGYSPTRPENSGGGKGGHKNIGCTIFTRPSKLTLMSSKRVHLRDFAPLSKCRSHNLIVDIQSKWNSLIMVELNVVATNQTLIVANTHLYWNPARPDIKLLQTVAAMRALDKYLLELGYNNSESAPPVILCGDFNSMPQMAPFEFLSTGALNSDHPQHPDKWCSRLGDSYISPQLGAFISDWRLENAYFKPEFVNVQPAFTTKTDDFQGWIDHIWCNKKVTISNVLVPPVKIDAGDASNFRPIPNILFPSDHIPLGVIATI